MKNPFLPLKHNQHRVLQCSSPLFQRRRFLFMALQAGVASSKVLVLVGAGLTGSIILRSGRLSELIAQFQELLKGLDEVEISHYKYDPVLLSAQIRQLAEEIKELSLSRPVTIFNGIPNGSWSSYVAPAVAVGAIGYFYMWWKDISFSDIMFVTKKNMTTAVENVSKQLDNLSESVALTRKRLSKRLEGLAWKIEDEIATSKCIAGNVEEMQSHLGKIEYDFDLINKMMVDLVTVLRAVRMLQIQASGISVNLLKAPKIEFPQPQSKKLLQKNRSSHH